MTEHVPTRTLAAPGLACISLTPLIRRTIAELEPGDVLEVQTDDPAAREGVPAWCRLTKNALVDTIEHDAVQTLFHIEAKNPNPTSQTNGKEQS